MPSVDRVKREALKKSSRRTWYSASCVGVQASAKSSDQRASVPFRDLKIKLRYPQSIFRKVTFVTSFRVLLWKFRAQRMKVFAEVYAPCHTRSGACDCIEVIEVKGHRRPLNEDEERELNALIRKTA